MQHTCEAIFENGVLRPLTPLVGIEEHQHLKVTVETEDKPHPLSACFGTMPDEDAAEMMKIIDEEFEKIDQDEWQ